MDSRGDRTLECKDVFKAFGAVQALNGASLDVSARSVHGLVGHNGAGKSTLVRLISGLARPDRGILRFEGRSLEGAGRRETIRRGIWSAPQELTVMPTLTVAENVCAGNEPRRWLFVNERAMRRLAVETLSELGAHNIAVSARVADLPPSQKRMVMIAMAVSRHARLLILDEPTAALGVDEAEPLLELIEGLPGRGISVIFVSHRLDEVERLCDRVTLMRDGQTRVTLERGEFAAEDLVRLLVHDLPPRVERTRPMTREGETTVSLRGVQGSSLRGINVDIRAGVITGFTGLVGSGADELLEIIAGGVRPTAGTLTVGGRPMVFKRRADALSAGVGYLPRARADAAFLELSLRENVLASSFDRVARAGVIIGPRERARAEELIFDFGLAPRVQRNLTELSGGNQQKVLIARLLGAEVDVLVVNDPTAGVDAYSRADIHALLRLVAEAGRTVVVRCSEPEELLDLADDIHVLAGGRIVQSFDAATVDANTLMEAAASSGVAAATAVSDTAA